MIMEVIVTKVSTTRIIINHDLIRPLQLNSLFPVTGVGRSGRAASIIIHVIHSLLACNAANTTISQTRVLRTHTRCAVTVDLYVLYPNI